MKWIIRNEFGRFELDHVEPIPGINGAEYWVSPLDETERFFAISVSRLNFTEALKKCIDKLEDL